MEIKKFTFPYLDLELFWTNDNKSKTKVHQKENQTLKFLKHKSTYSNAKFKLNLCGIFDHIEKLTSRTYKNIIWKVTSNIRETLMILSNMDYLPTFPRFEKHFGESGCFKIDKWHKPRKKGPGGVICISVLSYITYWGI